jgi:hypothetical protein
MPAVNGRGLALSMRAERVRDLLADPLNVAIVGASSVPASRRDAKGNVVRAFPNPRLPPQL